MFHSFFQTVNFKCSHIIFHTLNPLCYFPAKWMCRNNNLIKGVNNKQTSRWCPHFKIHLRGNYNTYVKTLEFGDHLLISNIIEPLSMLLGLLLQASLISWWTSWRFKTMSKNHNVLRPTLTGKHKNVQRLISGVMYKILKHCHYKIIHWHIVHRNVFTFWHTRQNLIKIVICHKKPKRF